VRAARIVGLGAVVGCGDSEGNTTFSDEVGEGEASATATTSSSTSTSTSTSTSSSTTTSTGSSESGAVDSGTSGSESGGGGTVVLQNDSWTPQDSLFWNTWANVDDCFASSYDIDAGLYPLELVAIEAAIGGATETQTFDVRVYTVDAMGAPDQLVDAVEVDIEGESGMDIVLADVGLVVPPFDSGSFAIAMCHVGHMGAPSIATDDDGTVDGGNNWVWQDIMGEWVSSPDFFGIDGDFILRAIVQPGG
jgi:hypothetical protein